MGKPKIRFKGFDDDWEQRKLGDLVNRVTRKNQDLVSELPLTISAQYGLIDQNEFFDKRVASKDVSGYYLIENGEFAYNKSTSIDAPWGAIKRLDRYENGVLSTLYIVFGIKENNPVDSDFLVSYYSTNLWHKGIHEIAAEGARNHGLLNIAPADFFETKLIIPQDIEEQKKIGKYFEELERLITLHQRKCDETKKLKKYMLQKMFPQNGQTVPEIRFSGFTDVWEQRKLGDVFEQTSNLVNPKEDEIELWSLTVEDGLTKKSDRYNREFLVKKDDNFKEVRPGDIVYNPMNMTLGAVGYNGMAKSVAVSGYYTTMVAKENYDTYYINTWLKSPQAIRLYRTYATGSLIEKQRVQFPTLSIIPVAFPKYEEQTKIGNYFHFLDNLITLHQQKCDELRNIKKFMLQNMFA